MSEAVLQLAGPIAGLLATIAVVVGLVAYMTSWRHAFWIACAMAALAGALGFDAAIRWIGWLALLVTVAAFHVVLGVTLRARLTVPSFGAPRRAIRIVIPVALLVGGGAVVLNAFLVFYALPLR